MTKKYTAAELHAEALSRIGFEYPSHIEPGITNQFTPDAFADYFASMNHSVIIRHFYDYSWRARFGRWWRHKVLRKPEPKWWGNASTDK